MLYDFILPRFPKHDKTVESHETGVDLVLFSLALSTSPHLLYVHPFCLLTEPLSRYPRRDQTLLVDITFCFWMSLSSISARVRTQSEERILSLSSFRFQLNIGQKKTL